MTSVFFHLAFWHVAFNVYWLYVLGSQMERTVGSIRYFGFFIASAIISSGAELALGGETGIGASGVAYAIFGFLWVTRKRFPAFKSILDSRTIAWFFVWLVACWVMTLTNVWKVGRSACLRCTLRSWRRGLPNVFTLS